MARGFVPGREALLQRDDQGITKRGKAEHRQGDKAYPNQPATCARPAGRQQHETRNPEGNNEIRRICKEPEDLRKRKEHLRVCGLAQRVRFESS